MFGVAHVFASFNDTFINSSTLFHQSQMKYAIMRSEEQSPMIMFLRLWRLLGFLGAKSSRPLLILWRMRSSLKWFASKAKQILKRKLFYPGTSTSYRVEYFRERARAEEQGRVRHPIGKGYRGKSKIIDLLQVEIEVIQKKGAVKTKTLVGMLMYEPTSLRSRKKDALEARDSEAEQKLHDLNLKLEAGIQRRVLKVAVADIPKTIDNDIPVKAAHGRVPVFVDGGIRRGTDIFKALALGTSEIFIGRSVVFSVAAEGEAGVQKVLQMLREEFELTMPLSGCRSNKEITRNHIVGSLGHIALQPSYKSQLSLANKEGIR